MAVHTGFVNQTVASDDGILPSQVRLNTLVPPFLITRSIQPNSVDGPANVLSTCLIAKVHGLLVTIETDGPDTQVLRATLQ